MADKNESADPNRQSWPGDHENEPTLRHQREQEHLAAEKKRRAAEADAAAPATNKE